MRKCLLQVGGDEKKKKLYLGNTGDWKSNCFVQTHILKVLRTPTNKSHSSFRLKRPYLITKTTPTIFFAVIYFFFSLTRVLCHQKFYYNITVIDFLFFFVSERRVALSKQLTQRMAQIIQCVGQNISHVKPLTTTEVVSFPFKVQIIFIISSRENKLSNCIIYPLSFCSLTFSIFCS